MACWWRAGAWALGRLRPPPCSRCLQVFFDAVQALLMVLGAFILVRGGRAGREGVRHLRRASIACSRQSTHALLSVQLIIVVPWILPVLAPLAIAFYFVRWVAAAVCTPALSLSELRAWVGARPRPALTSRLPPPCMPSQAAVPGHQP